MSHIKGKDTTPEILVRKRLFQEGFRYRINVKGLAGHPDIVLRKYHTVIFINGCFWHGHKDCKRATIPQTNTDFWLKKITSNVERDARNEQVLREEGWRVLTIWECELSPKCFEATIKRLITDIHAD